LKKAVDEAKEEWIGRVMREAECARRDGKQRWASIRKLQWLMWDGGLPDQHDSARAMEE